MNAGGAAAVSPSDLTTALESLSATMASTLQASRALQDEIRVLSESKEYLEKNYKVDAERIQQMIEQVETRGMEMFSIPQILIEFDELEKEAEELEKKKVDSEQKICSLLSEKSTLEQTIQLALFQTGEEIAKMKGIESSQLSEIQIQTDKVNGLKLRISDAEKHKDKELNAIKKQHEKELASLGCTNPLNGTVYNDAVMRKKLMNLTKENQVLMEQIDALSHKPPPPDVVAKPEKKRKLYTHPGKSNFTRTRP